MEENPNYLLGYGERLVEELGAMPGGGPKRHPYSLNEAKTNLLPLSQAAVKYLDELSDAACPNDHSVAVLTLHPTYLAKSYFPDGLIRSMGMSAIGSRSAEIVPKKWTKTTKQPKQCLTAELFVSASRKQFRLLPGIILGAKQSDDYAPDIIKLESLRAHSSTERLIKPANKDEVLFMELVIHARPTKEGNSILEAFEEWSNEFDCKPGFDDRLYAGGLCFLPLTIARDQIDSFLDFSFVRVAREMPQLRMAQPIVKGVSHNKFKVQLPDTDPLDENLHVAVFDGGVASDSMLERWVNRKKAPGVGDKHAKLVTHGTGVTSALLFGPLEPDQEAPQPYAYVDHFRVLDTEAMSAEHRLTLYPVLKRIRDILLSRQYEFVNISTGPVLPIDDNEVHAWTAVLDELFASGKILASIAVGNGGEHDRDTGLHRIQSPADCVNALSIGACDSWNSDWTRAQYSSFGPGRSPGVVKPDAVCFGGTNKEPFWTVSPAGILAHPQYGTSFAAPEALRKALAIRAHFGNKFTPLALKALLLHKAQESAHCRTEVGWGRIPRTIEELVLCPGNTVTTVYQGEMAPGEWVRMPIPWVDGISGKVDLRVTFCFASPTDPQDPISYTRAGLEVRFRPDETKFELRPNANRKLGNDQKPAHAKTDAFFQCKELYLSESELREDAHKWETTLHRAKTFKAQALNRPVFDVHYNARQGGRNDTKAENIPYALVVTVKSSEYMELYNEVVRQYRTKLEPLRPVHTLQIRV